MSACNKKGMVQMVKSAAVCLFDRPYVVLPQPLNRVLSIGQEPYQPDTRVRICHNCGSNSCHRWLPHLTPEGEAVVGSYICKTCFQYEVREGVPRPADVIERRLQESETRKVHPVEDRSCSECGVAQDDVGGEDFCFHPIDRKTFVCKRCYAILKAPLDDRVCSDCGRMHQRVNQNDGKGGYRCGTCAARALTKKRNESGVTCRQCKSTKTTKWIKMKDPRGPLCNSCHRKAKLAKETPEQRAKRLRMRKKQSGGG